MPDSPLDDSAEVTDLAVERFLGRNPKGVDFLKAHVAATGGQHRPQQEEMLTAVEESIAAGRPLLVQAGTGTGKSLAYAFAAAASGKRTVIATATNQLGEQLARKDLPMVADMLQHVGAELPVALLKGRANYVCKAKLQELHDLDSRAPGDDTLFPEGDGLVPVESDADNLRGLVEWADSTDSGDRSDGPPVPNRVWRQLSVSSAECAGSQCMFYDSCFTESARKKAKAARVVLTNHSLIAQDIRLSDSVDLGGGEGGLIGQAPVVIIDEAHSFAEAVTNALSTVVAPADAIKTVSKADPYMETRGSKETGRSRDVEDCVQRLDAIADILHVLPVAPLNDLPQELSDALTEAASATVTVARKLQQAANKASADGKPKRGIAILSVLGQVVEVSEALMSARATTTGTVRWVAESANGRQLCVAPIEVGDAVRSWADRGGHTLIATSATLIVGNSFAPLARTIGLSDAATLDVGTPFSYETQGMLYVPAPPFPAPVGKERVEHTEHVLKEIEALVEASGGRALVLFTTTAGAQRGAEHLRARFPGLTVLGHGDAPADVLVSKFREEEHSVLCATMGMWHGVDVPGPSCSLVIVDKIPFAPMDDALTAARRAAADEEGRNGFTDVFVADAAIDLAQAAGRLVRRADDRGVVAILDPRLHTKGYGRLLLDSLPPFPRFTDGTVVTAALERLTGGLPEGARKRPSRPRRASKSTGARPRGGSSFQGSKKRKAPPRRKGI